MSSGKKTQPPAPSVPRRILVLDRNPRDLKLLHKHLEAEGHEVVDAEGWEDALKHVAAGAADLLVLDANQSKVDGVSMCERLHAGVDTAAVPIIVVTDAKRPRDGRKALQMGADDFIARPLAKTELLTRIRTLLRMKELHDDLLARNAQLEQVNKERERVNQELASRNRELEQGMEMTHRLQEVMLPQHYPRVKNISFCHLYTPADVIGGDFFQISGMSNDRAAIFVADVSGHGIRAALITSILKTVFEHVYLEDKDPTLVLCDVNSRFRSVLGPLTPQVFATGFMVMVDGANLRLSLASAGHPCPVLVSKRNMDCEPLIGADQTGPALGFFSEPTYCTVERELSRGDIVLGFTDGVYEVHNERDEMYGLGRLHQLIARNARLIPRDLIQKLVTETDDFRGSHARSDDICLVAIEVN